MMATMLLKTGMKRINGHLFALGQPRRRTHREG